jgi:hypothetical protein
MRRRQTARYVNCSNSQFKSTPLYSYRSKLVNCLNSILPLYQTQQLNLNTSILLAITTYLISLTYLAFSSRYLFCPPSVVLLLSLCLFLYHFSYGIFCTNCYAISLHSSLQ